MVWTPSDHPHHAVPSLSLKIFNDRAAHDTLDPSDSSHFFHVLRQNTLPVASTSHVPCSLPLPHGSPQLFEEEGPVPFLPTQAACPICQPQRVSCAQVGPVLQVRCTQLCPIGQQSAVEDVCPSVIPKPLDFVSLISLDSFIHLFLQGLPLARSQPASPLTWATATLFPERVCL